MTFRIALFTVLLVSVISPVIYFSDLMFLYNEKRILQSSILIVIGSLTVFVSREKLMKTLCQLPNYFWVIFLLLFLLAFISSLFAPFPIYSAVEISLLLYLLLVGLITAYVTQNYSYGKYIVIGAACIFVLLYAIKFSIGYTFFLLDYESFPLWPAWGIKEGITGFSNVRFFNQVQAFTLPLLIGGSVVTISKNKTVGYLCLFLAVIWWMLLIQSAGRGIILSVLIAGLITLILYNSKTHQWVRYFLFTLVIGFLAKIILFEIIPDPDNARSILRGGSGRLTLWPKLLLATFEKPLLGHGPMAFAGIDTEYFRGHPHNSILQFLYEFGYPITLTILGLAFFGLKKWTKQSIKFLMENDLKNRNESVIRISVTTALFGGLLYSLFSGVIVMPLSQLWLALVFGTALGLYSKELFKHDEERAINSFHILTFKTLIIGATITLTSVLVQDVPNLRENERKFVKQTNRYVFRPRFWQQGKIGLEDYSKSELNQADKSNL